MQEYCSHLGSCWSCAADVRLPRLFSALGTTPHPRYSSCSIPCTRPACLRPLYHFHVRHKDGLVEDEEGLVLPHAAAAYAEAMRSALEFVADVEEPGRIQLKVRDAAGVEPLRVCRRLLLLRGWSHDEANTSLFP